MDTKDPLKTTLERLEFEEGAQLPDELPSAEDAADAVDELPALERESDRVGQSDA